MAAALAAAGCGSYQPKRAHAALAALVPPDTVMLAGVNLDQLRATPVFQQLAPGSTAFEDFARETGVDLRKDASEILLASNGAESVVLARGAFPSLADQPPRRLQRRGAGPGAYVLFDAQTAAAGPESALRRLLDRKGRSGGEALFRRADALPPGQAWAVLEGPVASLQDLPKGGNRENLNRIFRMVDRATLVADLRHGLQARVAGECRTDQDAKQLGDAVRGLLGLAKLGMMGEPKRLRLFDGVQVHQEKTSVKVSFDLPLVWLEQLALLEQ